MKSKQHSHTPNKGHTPAESHLVTHTQESTVPALDAASLEVALSTPQTMPSRVITQLQRSHGNQFVQRLIQRSQQQNHPSSLAPSSLSTAWNHPNNNLSALAHSDFSPFETTKSSEEHSESNTSDASDLLIQRQWDDLTLDYTTISNEKKQGQIRTGKIKWNSIEDWVVKFRKALAANKEKDAYKALIGLRSRLIDDQTSAAKGNLKPPKGVKTRDWDKESAKLTALNFFQKWLGATQAHIDHADQSGNWLSDFRNVYLQTQMPILVMDDSQEESSEEGTSSTSIVDNRTPREKFLDNARELEQMSRNEYEGLALLWDRGPESLRERITSALGSTDDALKSLGNLEYFLEAINLEHIGYAKIRSIYQEWLTGVNDYGIEATFDDWVAKKKDNIEGGRVQYFTPEKREEYRLKPTGQNMLQVDDNPIVGDNIYVLSGEDVWYGGAKDREGKEGGSVHHSSFMAGKPVKCAGHIKTDSSGKLLTIDDNSGHYAPNKPNLKRAVAVLKSQMDTSEVMVTSYGGRGGQTVDQFLASK